MLRKILDSPWLYFGLAAALLVGGLLSIFDFEGPPRPVGGTAEIEALRERDDVNVVFILIDMLRADRLSAYGHERETSPMIDYLAETGIRFSSVQAQSSWTKSSMASLWTGGYPRRIGVTRYTDGLSDELVTAAERFKEAGFFTAGVFRNGWVEANFGFAQGFDVYLRPSVTKTPKRFERKGPPSTHPLDGTDRDVTDATLEFLNSHGHQRFFLYLHMMDVHQYLYAADLASFGTTLVDSYDNAIRWTDRNIEAIVAVLAEKGLMDETIIVIASDHGEAFGEHGVEGHARNLYWESVETPLIVSLPFRIEGGLTVETPVQNVDIWPTVLDLLGLPALPELDGRSTLPLIQAAAGVPGAPTDGLADRTLLSELDLFWGRTDKPKIPMVTLQEDGERLIYVTGRQDQEFFDRRVDPGEQDNIADEHPERVAELSERAKAYLEAPATVEVPQVELDAMRKAQLQALGYVDLK